MTTPALAVVANPISHANRTGGLAALRAVAEGGGGNGAGVAWAEPAGRGALRAALAGFAGRGVATLAVSGGDGTLREVLTALPDSWPGPPPALALLPAGKTDVAALDVGSAGRGAAGLARLLAALRDGAPLRRVERPVLELRRAGEPRLRGLLFGAAAFAEGQRLAGDAVHRRGLFGGAAVGATVALLAARALLGGGPLAAGQAMRLRVDAGDGPGPERPGARFLVLATTLDRLSLDLWPFPEAGRGPLHWLDVPAPPRRLLPELWAARAEGRRRTAGRPAGARRAAEGRAGHAGGRAETLSLRFEEHSGGRFVLDGEAYEAGAPGVELSAPARQVFVSP